MTIEYQQALRNAGFATFPLNGKIPLVKEWQKLTVDTCEDPLLGNYGVVIPPGVLVIDADPRNYRMIDEVKDNPLTRLAQVVGGLPETYTIYTGGGGIHKYFTIPTMSVAKKNPSYPGLDFLTVGCFVVGPGSIHPETQTPYTVAPDSLDGIAAAPDELIALLVTQGRDATTFIADEYPDDPLDKQWFAEYLKGAAPVAVEGEGGDETTYKVAAKGRDKGLLPESTLELMLKYYNCRCTPPWSDDELRTKVDNAYKYGKYAGGHQAFKNHTHLTSDELDLMRKDFKESGRTLYITPNKAIHTGFSNVATLLTTPSTLPGWTNELFALVRMNVMTGNAELARTPPWASVFQVMNGRLFDDGQIAELRYYLCQRYGGEWSTNNVYEGVMKAAREKPYHPIKQYLNSLVWDGKPRLANWLANYCGAEDTEFNDLVGEAIILGGVARAYMPGCKWDYLPILESEQGGLKSSFVELLANEPRFYASLTLTTNDEKRMYESLAGKWIVEVPELSGHHKAEVNALKKFLSDTTSHFRDAYGRVAKEHVKHCNLIATFNPESIGYLSDVTGNRRFLPVRIKRCPKKETAVALIEQLYAESAYKFLHKDRYNTFPYAQMEELGRLETDARMNLDPWAHILADWVAQKPESTTFTIAEAARGALNIEPQTLSHKFYARVSRSLASLKLPYKTVSVNGLQQKLYSTRPDALFWPEERRFEEVITEFKTAEMPLSRFIVDVMGLDDTPRRRQMIGRLLNQAGHRTTRRLNADGVKETWVINCDRSAGL